MTNGKDICLKETLPEGSLVDPKQKKAPVALECPTSIRAKPGSSIALWEGLVVCLVEKSYTTPPASARE